VLVARVATASGSDRTAEKSYRQALRLLFDAEPDELSYASTWKEGRLLSAMGDWQLRAYGNDGLVKARNSYQAAARDFRATGQEAYRAATLDKLALVYQRLKDPRAAEASAEARNLKHLVEGTSGDSQPT
jgi:hypothetical protein